MPETAKNKGFGGICLIRAGFPELFFLAPTIVPTIDLSEGVTRQLLFSGSVTVELLFLGIFEGRGGGNVVRRNGR